MRIFIRIIITALLAFFIAIYLPGIPEQDYIAVMMIAVLVSVLNAMLRPVIVMLSYPFTLLTIGIILLLINAVIVKVAANFVDGFSVNSWMTAVLFGLIFTVITFIIDRFLFPSRQH